MKQNEQTGYPSLDNLEGKTVEELLALRQEIRQLRDRQRTATNDEITARQTELRREGINERRIFDIQLNELKRQLEEIGDRQGQPAWRIKATEVREKMSELKYKYNMAVLERDAQDARLAIERIRRNAQNQLDYENAEIVVCKASLDRADSTSLECPRRSTTMAKRQTNGGIRITRDLLAKALTWHCPYYTRDGVASCCDTGDGHPTNCQGPAQLCTHVTDVFQTMAKIQKGEIEVW